MIFDSWMWFLFFPSFGKTITLFISSANIFFLWYFHMESCVTVYMIINFRTIDGVCHIFQNWSFQAAAWWWESPYRLLVMAVILLECLWCYSSSLLYINQCCYVFFSRETVVSFYLISFVYIIYCLFAFCVFLFFA